MAIVVGIVIVVVIVVNLEQARNAEAKTINIETHERQKPPKLAGAANYSDTT